MAPVSVLMSACHYWCLPLLVAEPSDKKFKNGLFPFIPPVSSSKLAVWIGYNTAALCGSQRQGRNSRGTAEYRGQIRAYIGWLGQS